jgi:hypothetical protein
MTFDVHWLPIIILLVPAALGGWYLWLLLVHEKVMVRFRGPTGRHMAEGVSLSRRDQPIRFWTRAILYAAMLVGCAWLALFLVARYALAG